MKSITKQKLSFNFKLTKITPLIALVFLISCTPQWEERGFASEEEQLRAEAMGFIFHKSYSEALALGIPDERTLSAFYQSEFVDWGDQLNRDNADQFMAATEAGFDVKEDYIKAKKSNIETKEDLLTAVQVGGFYSIDNYFKAKELGISTQKELTKYEYDEVILSGLRLAGKEYKNTYRCQDVSWRLTGSLGAQGRSRETEIFRRFESFFRDKNSFTEMDIEISTLNEKERRVFFNAVGRGTPRTGWDNQALYNGRIPRGSNPEKSYFIKNCGRIAKSTCIIARARSKSLESGTKKSKKNSSLIRACNFFAKNGQLG